jgi:hypothetical protein
MEFTSRADQLDYVFRRFIDFICAVAAKAEMPVMEADRLREAPSVALIGKAVELEKKYSDGLKKHDMGTVLKMIVEQCAHGSPDEITRQSMTFVAFLEADREANSKFFQFTDIILDLLN